MFRQTSVIPARPDIQAPKTKNAPTAVIVGVNFAPTGRLGQVVLAGIVSIGVAVLIGAGAIKQRTLFTTNETGTIIDADQIADFLSADLHSGDSLIGNAIFKYELQQRNPRLYKSLADPKGAAHLVVVVVKSAQADDPRVLASQIDLNAYTPPRVLARFVTSTVYSLDRR